VVAVASLVVLMRLPNLLQEAVDSSVVEPRNLLLDSSPEAVVCSVERSQPLQAWAEGVSSEVPLPLQLKVDYSEAALQASRSVQQWEEASLVEAPGNPNNNQANSARHQGLA
jgi:hypothetical protein